MGKTYLVDTSSTAVESHSLEEYQLNQEIAETEKEIVKRMSCVTDLRQRIKNMESWETEKETYLAELEWGKDEINEIITEGEEAVKESMDEIREIENYYLKPGGFRVYLNRIGDRLKGGENSFDKEMGRKADLEKKIMEYETQIRQLKTQLVEVEKKIMGVKHGPKQQAEKKLGEEETSLNRLRNQLAEKKEKLKDIKQNQSQQHEARIRNRDVNIEWLIIKIICGITEKNRGVISLIDSDQITKTSHINKERVKGFLNIFSICCPLHPNLYYVYPSLLPKIRKKDIETGGYNLLQRSREKTMGWLKIRDKELETVLRGIVGTMVKEKKERSKIYRSPIVTEDQIIKRIPPGIKKLCWAEGELRYSLSKILNLFGCEEDKEYISYGKRWVLENIPMVSGKIIGVLKQHESPLPVKEIINRMGEEGVPEGSTKSELLRMLKKGLVEKTKRGWYRLKKQDISKNVRGGDYVK